MRDNNSLSLFTGINMVEKPQSPHALGLEISGSEVRGAKLSQKRGVPTLDSLFIIPITDKEIENVKPLYIPASGKSLNDVAKRYLVASTLAPGDVLVRAMDVTLKKTSDIDSVLAFQAEPLLPFPTESAILDRIILSQNTNGTHLTLLAARKDRVQALIDTWKMHDIEPDAITCVPAALAAFSGLVTNNEESIFVIHMTYTQTVCILVKNGQLIASQSCSIHLGTLEKAFIDDAPMEDEEEKRIAFKNFRWDDITDVVHPHLKQTLEQLDQELSRTLFSLTKQNKGQEIKDVLLTGDCGSNYDLMFYLGAMLNKHVVTPEIPPSFNTPLPQMLKFAVPIGTALSYLPQTKDAVNFRQQELAFPDPWKRLKKPMAIYFGLCLAVATSIYVFGEAYLGSREDSVRSEYTDLLKLVQKPHSAFEAHLGNTDSSTIALKNITMDQLRERVAKLEKEIAETPDVFPLLPNILTVSDVLAWLNTQPTVVQKDPKSGKTVPLIQIDNFSYNMVKRPEITKKNERYQVKIEIEFSTPTPKEAREFHDALIAPNSVVDPKGEVKWSTNRGKYKASFFLKDRTTYPTTN